MKYPLVKQIILIFIFSIWNLALYPQLPPNPLRDYILANKSINMEVKDFYAQIQYQTAWVKRENQFNYQALQKVLKLSTAMGLRERDYPIISSVTILNTNEKAVKNTDSMQSDILITTSAIHFFNDIAYGNTRPNFGFIGLKIDTVYRGLPKRLAEHIAHKNIADLMIQLRSFRPEIMLIQNKIQWYLSILASADYKEITATKVMSNINNLSLVLRLYQLGFVESNNFILTDSVLKLKIKDAQLQFNQLPDGVLRNNLLKELNIPIEVRLKQLILSLNYYRWLSCTTQNQTTLVVNIPAANLKVYQNDAVAFQMKMIVGKKSTPTPTLCSIITEVILYPYWHVPYSIATKELLPLIKKNPAYIQTGNYQILNKEGAIMNPYSVDWKSLNSKYFPYLIRQSTGCDNALGLLKLNFDNPFGVYLHDTPGKNLFSFNKRFLSHGCMRMEKPMEIGHLVLKNNPLAIDTLEQKGCLRNQSPIRVPADEQIPIIVWYNPVGIDSTGRLVFYEDVYGKFNWKNIQPF